MNNRVSSTFKSYSRTSTRRNVTHRATRVPPYLCLEHLELRLRRDGCQPTQGRASTTCAAAGTARELLLSKAMDKQQAQAVVFKALQIARLMDEICELASDLEIAALICEAYPFGHSLDEVSSEVIAWRDAMAEKAKVALAPATKEIT